MQDMQEKIEGRELIVLDGFDTLVRGTYHKPNGLSLLSNVIERNRMGVLFLNGLYATRAGTGDSAVGWADWIAQCGYPAFRLDLPGFGDAGGDPPTEWLGFINQGGYAAVAADNIKELVARFNLAGFVIVGHCAGAVSAIYTAAVSGECKGLVLMDPYFHLPRAVTAKTRRQLNAWARKNRFGGLLSKIYDLLKQIRLILRRNALPENANLALLRCWKEVASTGLPLLMLKAPSRGSPGMKSRVGEFDYFEYLLRVAGRKSQIVVKVMEGANHSFSNKLGRAAVQEHTERWLNAYFPLTQHPGAESRLGGNPGENAGHGETLLEAVPQVAYALESRES